MNQPIFSRSLFNRVHTWSILWLATLLVSGVFAQESDPRVSGVNRPLPVGGIPILPMTGTWRFAIEHGGMFGTGYESATTEQLIFTASSSQGESIPMYAFNIGHGSNNRWCAVSGDMPQWVQADLGALENVAGIELKWEKSDATYQCKVEGSLDGTNYTTLIDKTDDPGVGDGKLTWVPAQARYVRITVTKVNAQPYGWASMSNCKIHVLRNGADVVWKPSGLTAEQSASQNKFADPLFSDDGWKDIPVPSNWEMLGYSRPLYNGVDDTVGLYRRLVNVPSNFAGQRVYWRFDGVFESAEVFVNGKRVGYHESGFTAFDMDLTDFVVPGQLNLFAVRVCKSVPSYDMETGDFEALGGIYRNNFLYAVPPTHLSDITIRTTLDKQYVNATLEADLEVTGRSGQTVQINGSLVDASGKPVQIGPIASSASIGTSGKGKITLSIPVPHPLLWSAEKPNLYKLNLTLAGPIPENIEQPFGFRQIEIGPDQSILWNGVPIKCAGTCRHEIYPTLGSALTDEVWMKDITLMKGANINAIRTSHYNHAARFMDLCDQTGFYILDEIPFCWIQDYVNDPTYIPALLQRSYETLERDKNRPSVLAWSCGNENPLGSDEQVVLDFVHQLDPVRPAFSSGMRYNDLKGQTFTDFHYPWPSYVEELAKNEGKHAPVVFTENPHIFWQQTWQKYDPGVSDLWGEVLSKDWKAVDSRSCFVGSFIWEWQDQPIVDKFEDGGRDKVTNFRYQNDKGIVTGYRVPKPEYWAVKMAYSPIKVDLTPVPIEAGACKVTLTNRYSFTNVNELKCKYQALSGDKVVGSGDLPIDCSPQQSTSVSVPSPSGTSSVQLTFYKASGDLITGAVVKIAGVPDRSPPLFSGQAEDLKLEPGDTPKVTSVSSELDFDSKTGQINHWKIHQTDLINGSSEFNLGQGFPNDDTGLKEFVARGGPLSLTDAKWTAAKKDDGSVEAISTATVKWGEPSETVGTLTTTYMVHSSFQLEVRWTLAWTGPKKKAWEIGQKLMLPSSFSHLTWLRDSVFSYYPPDHLGVPAGSCNTQDVRFRASKRGLHWLTLTDSSGSGLALMQLDGPLIGRANSNNGNTTLFASLEEAGPQDFSGSWVDNHAISLQPGKSVTGSYLLCPALLSANRAAQ